jgi:hypothetical protein
VVRDGTFTLLEAKHSTLFMAIPGKMELMELEHEPSVEGREGSNARG